MEELVIQTHDFEESKNQLKKFSEETATDLDLKRVDSGKGVGEFFGDLFLGRGIGTDHIVKGSELNSLTTDIQQHLIDINNMHRSFIGEIGHVYTALESLDKDYIQAILIAVKSAQKANGEAKIAQADIEKTIEEQKKIIKVLQQFKEKLDKFKHIVDIDKMWGELQNYQKNVTQTQKSLTTLEQFKSRIDKSQHLSDIDKMWNDAKNQEKEIDGIKERNTKINDTLETQTERIAELMLVKEITDSLEHISDVDKMWQNVQTANDTIDSLDKSVEQLIRKIDEQANLISSNNGTLSKIVAQKFIYSVDEIKAMVDELEQKMNSSTKEFASMEQSIDELQTRIEKIESIVHLSDVDSMYDEIQNLKEMIDNLNKEKDSLIVDNSKLSNNLEEIEKDFAKKLKIAYAIACGSIGLVIIEFVLAMMGLM